MENVSTLIICLILLVICFYALFSFKKKLKNGCCGGGGEVRIKPENSDKSHYAHKKTVCIDGMTCDHCKMRVENALNRKSGCLAKVNLRKKYAEVWTEKPMSDDELKSTIKSIGYTFIKCITEK